MTVDRALRCALELERKAVDELFSCRGPLPPKT